jgi:CBS domain-containing protein
MPAAEKHFIDLTVGDVYEFVKGASQVPKSAKIRDAIDEMMRNPVSRKVYVVDQEGNLAGVIRTESILRLMGYRVGVRENVGLSFYLFLRDTLKEDVEQIIEKPHPVKKETKLTEALRLMIELHSNDLPVVDDTDKLIGEVISLEMFVKGRQLFDKQ